MAGSFTVHPLLTLPVFSIYVSIKQFFVRAVSRDGERSEWETEVAAELVPVPVTEKWIKKGTTCQASQRNGSPITVDAGSHKEAVSSRSILTSEDRIRKALWTSAQGPTYRFWLTYREHPASLLWPSIMQMCWRTDSNTYVVCGNSSYFLIST